jgi:hypothetical protein
MGYIKHHAIIVSSWNREAIQRAHAEAVKIFGPKQISSIVSAVVNLQETFIIGPDGSSEYWSESEDGDQKRFDYICWMQNNSYEDGSSMIAWTEVVFKDEKGIPRVTQFN